MPSNKHLHKFTFFSKEEEYEPSQCSYRDSNIYSETRKKLPNALHIAYVNLYSHMDNNLFMEIGLRNYFHYEFIKNLLRPLGLNEENFSHKIISLYFDLASLGKHKVVFIIKEILEKLKISENISSDIQNDFLNQLQQHFMDIEKKFPGGNLYEREGRYPCQHHEKSSHSKKEKKLFTAVIEGDADTVKHLLEDEVDPDLDNDHLTLLTAAILIGPRYAELSKLLQIIRLLVLYGANLHKKGKLDKTTLEALIDHVIEDQVRGEISWSHLKKRTRDNYERRNMFSEKFSEILRYAQDENFVFQGSDMDWDVFCMKAGLELIATNKTEPHITVPNGEQSLMGQFINYLNRVLLERKAKQPLLYNIQPISSKNIPLLQIKTQDNKEFIVTIKKIEQLNSHDKESMYSLFRKHFKWQGKVKEENLKDYFHETFIKTDKPQTYFDLIWDPKEKKLVGYNIAEVEYKGSNLFYHRIKFAMSILKYERLMRFLSFWRGIVFKKNYPDINIYTGYEMTSFFSFLQLWGYKNFPKYKTDGKLAKIFYPEGLEKKNGAYYIVDELMEKTSDEAISRFPFWTPQGAICRHFRAQIEKEGESPVGYYPIDPFNTEQLYSEMDPNLDGDTCKQVIDKLAKQNEHTQSYSRL